jgi:enterobactin synthetase component D
MSTSTAPSQEQPHCSDEPWSRTFHLALPHGILVGVRLPAGDDPVSPDVIKRLHPKERAKAGELNGVRAVQWVGGRLALQLALKRLRSRRAPFLAKASGAVQAPKGLYASVSHKRDLAVGLVGPSSAGTVGVDLECLAPDRSHLAERILTPAEIERWRHLPASRRWPVLLLHFSIKESIYKALHPHVQRYVGFQEAELDIGPNGSAEVALRLEGGEGPFELEAHYHWLADHLLTTVRLRPTEASG